MPVTNRTVEQTVSALLATYRTDIKGAARDSVLSRTEQQKLSDWAKRHIEKMRASGKPVSVAAALAQLRPLLTRAARDIAGPDGMVDAADVKKLRVTELRTRATSLFEGGGNSGIQAGMKAALKGVDVKELTDYGRNFALDTHASGTVARLVAEIADIDADNLSPMSDWATVTKGPAALKAFTTVVRQAGKDAMENAETPELGKKLKTKLDAVATAVEANFKPADFKQVVHVRHTIFEDGDVEYNILLAQKKDGSWVSLTHSNYPF